MQAEASGAKASGIVSVHVGVTGGQFVTPNGRNGLPYDRAERAILAAQPDGR